MRQKKSQPEASDQKEQEPQTMPTETTDPNQQVTTPDTEVNVAEPTLVSLEQAEQALLSKPIARLLEQQKLGIVNPIVLAEAIGVRPQMVYNYIRSGRIKAVKHNNTQKLVIEWKEAVAFAQRYMDRKARAELKRQQELAGDA
jgi:hypothetical protein